MDVFVMSAAFIGVQVVAGIAVAAAIGVKVLHGPARSSSSLRDRATPRTWQRQ
ncbi:hypothetical protein [Deinococcus sedimenti]|uniref:hypothetical protein n=1 Tax=Deinococcus sedimenti TaxID=1867090 RepID=UPI00166933FA|nr:hypothetical protein [Deinococcus sedimenti]